MKRIYFFLGIALLMTVVMAAPYNTLVGSYRLGGSTFYDPPENEPQNTHLYFELTGTAARDLYNAMKVKSMADDCGDIGTNTKLMGEMQCTKSVEGIDYRCWFGIDVAHQKITRAATC